MRKKTFKYLGLALALALFSSPSFANCFLGPCEKADLPTCDAKLHGRTFEVKNCVSSTSCATTGTEPALLVCDTNAYRAVNAEAADLGTIYVPITKAGQQTWTATGAGNDATIVAADDVIASPTDTFRVNSAQMFDNVSDTWTGTYLTAELASTNGFSFDTGGGTNELEIFTDSIAIGGEVYFGLTGTEQFIVDSAAVVPTTATDTCTKGTLRFNSSHLYYCHATDQWVRSAWAAW